MTTTDRASRPRGAAFATRRPDPTPARTRGDGAERAAAPPRGPWAMSGRARRATTVAAATLTLALGACDLGDILDVDTPDLVVPGDLQGAEGAAVLWSGAVGDFAVAYSAGEGGQILHSGLFADEFYLTGTFPTRLQVDARNVQTRNFEMETEFRNVHRARVAARNAGDELAALEGSASDPRVAEMRNLEAFTYVLLGENYCSGMPFSHTPRSGEVVYGEPLTTAETFEAAIEVFDRALEATAGSAEQLHLARVGKARALVNLGRLDEAADVAEDVPTSFEYAIRHSDNTGRQGNAVWEQTHLARRWSLSDGEGGNGMDFRSAMDPRVPWQPNGLGFDGGTPQFDPLKYADLEASVPLASGIEARLIEAEAALAAGDAGDWRSIHAALRADVGLGPLADPGSAAARVSTHFRERALWLFATSHRLGDLRRLIRQYGRDAESVFPTGMFFKGGFYGTDVNLPIPFDEANNPNFEQCLDRGA